MAGVRYVDATRIYPGATVPSVNKLNLDIPDGEFCVLVGPSGSGKSTALRMLAGLEDVDLGAIYIGDRHVRVQRVVLEHHRDVALFGRQIRDVPVADVDRAQIDVFQPGQHSQGGRLSGS